LLAKKFFVKKKKCCVNLVESRGFLHLLYKYKDSLFAAILLSGFATVVSAALSSYLFSIGSLAGIAFFYPTIIGLGTMLFLLYKNYYFLV